MTQLSWDLIFLGLCWNCRSNEQKFGCSSCKFARYCSQICQQEHWKLLHGTHCKYLSGKKVIPSSKHNPETCNMCRQEPGKILCTPVKIEGCQSVMVKKFGAGVVCHIGKHDTDLEKFKMEFISLTKYGFDLKMAEKCKKEWSHVNLPFQFGELSGKYLDFLDKLFSFLQILLATLVTRYPQHGKLSEMLEHVTNLRVVHWGLSLIHGVAMERIDHTTELIQKTLFSMTGHIFMLNNAIRKVESQEDISAWNSFMFLFEMLGIYTKTIDFSSVDVTSFNELDQILAMNKQDWEVVVEKEELNLRTDSFVDQVKDLVKCFELLTIFEQYAGNKLQKFQTIYEQFFPTSNQATESEHYSCELCHKNVDRKNCKYVFHSYYPHLDPFFEKPENLNQKHSYYSQIKPVIGKPGSEEQNKVGEMSLAQIVITNHDQQIDTGKAYITYNIGSGMKVICNEGGCQDVYTTHVAKYRDKIATTFLALASKYRTKFTYLKCWVCKTHSGESHRCSTCKSRQYCSRECQTKDWKIHETICARLVDAGDQVKSDSQERKEQGELRAEKGYKKCLRGHEQCDEKNCQRAHQIKSLYGKLTPEVQINPKSEVD